MNEVWDGRVWVAIYARDVYLFFVVKGRCCFHCVCVHAFDIL